MTEVSGPIAGFNAPHPDIQRNLSATRERTFVHPHGLVGDVDAALGQQVFYVPQRKREADIHHHYQSDHLG